MPQHQNTKFDLESVIEKLIQVYPNFYDSIVKKSENWISKDGKILWTVLFGMLADLIKQRMCSGEFDGVEEVFQLMEEIVSSKCEPASSAVTTGFLEALVNSIDENFSAKLFVELLGPSSKSFIKNYDKFTEVKTDGL